MINEEIDALMKPCPFCGGKVDLTYQGSSDWSIECETCPIQGGFWVDAHIFGYGEGETMEVVKRWNTRVDEKELARLRARVSKLEEALKTIREEYVNQGHIWFLASEALKQEESK